MNAQRAAAVLRSASRRLEEWADRLDPALDHALRTVLEIDAKVDAAQAADAITRGIDIAYGHPMTQEAGKMKREQDASLRRELEAEAKAEFGCRIPDPITAVCSVCGTPLDLLTISSGGRCTNEDCRAVGIAVPATWSIPDPASPGGVWPRDALANVSHLTAYGRAIRRGRK